MTAMRRHLFRMKCILMVLCDGILLRVKFISMAAIWQHLLYFEWNLYHGRYVTTFISSEIYINGCCVTAFTSNEIHINGCCDAISSKFISMCAGFYFKWNLLSLAVVLRHFTSSKLYPNEWYATAFISNEVYINGCV